MQAWQRTGSNFHALRFCLRWVLVALLGAIVACTARGGFALESELKEPEPSTRERGPTGEALVVTRIEPPQGPVSGGTEIILTGEGFDTTTQIELGSQRCLPTVVVSPTVMRCQTPQATTAGVVALSARRGDGADTVVNGAFEYIWPAPTLSTLEPNSASAAGGDTLRLVGTGFRGLPSRPQVRVGGSLCTPVTVVSQNEAFCTLAAHAGGTVDVSLENYDGQQALAAGGFTYVASFVVSALNPPQGPLAGGGTLVLVGSGFRTPAPAVFVGDVPCTEVQVVASTELRCTLPERAAGPAVVRVENNVGEQAIAPEPFTYVAPPTISNVIPSVGLPAGGTPVTVLGTNFIPGTTMTFDDGSGSGPQTCSSLQRISDSELRCAGSPPSSLSPGAFGGVVSHPASLRVIQPAPVAQTATQNAGFVYTQPGALDHSFGTDGLTQIQAAPGGVNILRGLALQPDGGIVVAGTTASVLGDGNAWDFWVARLRTDGALDPAFDGSQTGVGGPGWAQIDFAAQRDYASDVAVQGDGRVVVSGEATGALPGGNVDYDMAAVQLQPNGSVVNSIRIDVLGDEDISRDLLIGPDGLYLGGFSRPPSGSDDMVLIRLLPNTLQPDASFGGQPVLTASGPTTGGAMVHAITTGNDRINALALAGGDVLAVGYATPEVNKNETAVVRVNAAGVAQSTALLGGLAADDSIAWGAVLESSTTLIIGGEADDADNTGGLFTSARIALGGLVLDPSFSVDGFDRWQLGSGAAEVDRAYTVTVQSDGAVVSAGRARETGSVERLALVRHTSDGTRDSAFGDSGVVLLNAGVQRARWHRIALQTDGKLVTAGWFGDCTTEFGCEDQQTWGLVARFWP